MRKHKSIQDKNQFKEAHFESSVMICVAAFLTAHFIASFFVTGRTWGFHHWMFYPLVLRTVLFFGLLFCVPGTSGIIIKYSKSFISKITPMFEKINTYLLGAVFAVFFFFLFWVFRVRIHLLGDGQFLIRTLIDGRPMGAAEPLDSHIHYLVFRLLNGQSYQAAEMSYVFISCFAGACLLFFMILLSHLIGKSLFKRAILFLSVLSMGAIQLFFGYVESYSLQLVGILAYIFVSIIYLRNKCGMFLPSLVLSLTVCFHLSAAIFLPTLLYLYFVRLKKRSFFNTAFFSLLKMALGIAVPIILLVILAMQVGFDLDVFRKELSGKSHILPLLSDKTDPNAFRYGLLSVTHMINIMNEIILIAPISLIIMISSLFYHRSQKSPMDRSLIFLFLLSILSLVYMLSMKPDLGASRDWDLFALCAIPWTLNSSYLLITSTMNKERLMRIGLLLIVASFLHTVPWILVNASTDKSLERFKVLSEKDSSWTNEALANAYDELALFYKNREMVDEWIYFSQKAVTHASNPRFYVTLGAAYLIKGMPHQAISELKKVDDNSPHAADAHCNIGIAYLKLNEVDKALSEFEVALQKNPQHNLARKWLEYAKRTTNGH